MEELLFLLESDKQIKRQILILDCLTNDKIKGYLAVDELVNEIKVNRSTIVSDINALSLKLPFSIKIEKVFRKGYKLITFDLDTVDSFIVQMIKDSNSYKIINKIARSKYSQTSLAESLFISNITLNNIIDYMNNVLKTYKISISKGKVKFNGNESDIRFFLFSYYKNFRSYFVFRDESGAFSKTYNNFIKSVRYISLPKLHVSYYNLKIWILIVITRLEGGNYVKVDNSLREIVLTKESYVAFNKMYRQILDQSSNVKYSQEEIDWAYIVLLSSVIYTKRTENVLGGDFIYRREEDQEILETIRNFVFNGLRSIYSEEVLRKTDTSQLENYLVNLRLLCLITPQFQRVSLSIKELVKNNYSKIFNMWRKEIEYINSIRLFKVEYYDDLAVTLTMLTNTIIDYQETTKTKILFSFQGEPGVIEHLLNLSSNYFNDEFNVVYFFTEALTYQTINKINADIIVCNYDLKLEKLNNHEVINLPRIPTVQDWLALKEKLTNYVI